MDGMRIKWPIDTRQGYYIFEKAVWRSDCFDQSGQIDTSCLYLSYRATVLQRLFALIQITNMLLDLLMSRLKEGHQR